MRAGTGGSTERDAQRLEQVRLFAEQTGRDIVGLDLDAQAIEPLDGAQDERDEVIPHRVEREPNTNHVEPCLSPRATRNTPRRLNRAACALRHVERHPYAGMTQIRFGGLARKGPLSAAAHPSLCCVVCVAVAYSIDVPEIQIRAAEPTDAEALYDIFSGPRAVAGTLQLPWVSLESRRAWLTPAT